MFRYNDQFSFHLKNYFWHEIDAWIIFFIVIHSICAWLAIPSPFNHIFPFWYWWRYLMPSQVCSMTHYIYRFYYLKVFVWNYVSKIMMPRLIIHRVYRMFDWFEGGSFRCSSALCLFWFFFFFSFTDFFFLQTKCGFLCYVWWEDAVISHFANSSQVIWS